MALRNFSKTLLLLLIFSTTLFAQFKEQGASFDPRDHLLKPTEPSSFLNMNGITMDHTLSMSYTSGQDNSHMLSEYVAGFNYRISNPLRFRMELGASYVPYTTYNLGDSEYTDIYVKSAELRYRPSDSFRLVVSYRDYSKGNYYYDPFYRRRGFMSSNNPFSALEEEDEE